MDFVNLDSNVGLERKIPSHLSNELISLIAEFLDGDMLFICEEINRQWRIVVNDTRLWLPLTRHLWTNTRYMVNIPIVVPLLNRIKKVCTIIAMKKALKACDTSGLLEKIEFMTLLRAKLLFGFKNCARSGDGKTGWVSRLY